MVEVNGQDGSTRLVLVLFPVIGRQQHPGRRAAML